MIAATAAQLASGTRVKIKEPGAVPVFSSWEDDAQRTSTPVKKRLQTQFFAGHKGIAGEILYVGNETDRDRMKAKGLCKVQIRDQAGSMIVITAPMANLKRCA